MCHTTVANIAVHNWKRTPSVTNRSPRPMEDGMRFHVVYDSSTPVRRRHLAGADAKDRYAIIRLVGMAGSIKSRHRGFCFSAPISPPLLFSAQTEKIAFNAVGFRHVRQVSSGGVLSGGLALVLNTPGGFRHSWLGYRHHL